MTNSKTLIAAARLLLDVAETLMESPSETVAVPAAEEIATPNRRKKYRKALRTSKTATTTTVIGRRGRPKGAKDYICVACNHGFRAVNPIQCPNPECGAHDNCVLKKDFNSEDFPSA